MGSRRSRSAHLLVLAALVLAAACPCARADFILFSDGFDDGDWTANPRWEWAQSDPSVSVSTERSTSGQYSLKIDAANALGAIRAFSGLSSADHGYTFTFNLFVESLGDEAIPWCLQSTGGVVVAIIFIMPNGRVQLFVKDSADTWSGVSADAPEPVTYGQWHSFRVTFDGSTTRLYIDGHTQPDASVTQGYIRTPGRIVVGNFSLPHTSTIYLDDILITAPARPDPARIYVQVCSDTSTDGLGTSTHYNNFPIADWTYTSPSGQAAQVMAESFRTSHRDSLGNPIRFTWYMLCGSIYACGVNTGPLLPFELMQDNHADSIERWGDELAFHYHTWIWSDPDGDTVYHWNQAPDFSYCRADFDQTIAHMILDRAFYPSSFRSGWHYMDSLWQRYLDELFPYRFENDHPNYRTQTEEPIGNVYDWRRSPSAWAPYHPDPNDYQSVGSLRGWESRSRYIKSLSKSQLEDAFVQALAGAPQLMTLFSHLKESDFPTQVSNLHAMLSEVHDSLPAVDFEYVTGRESMLKWRGGTDMTPPEIEVVWSDDNGVRAALITTSEPIYQLEPFAALATAAGVYAHPSCVPSGPNRWTLGYDLLDTLKVAVGVTDWFGNARVRFLPVPLRVCNVRAAAGTTTATIDWETNLPAQTTLEYELLPDGIMAGLDDSQPKIVHHAALTGLLPGRVYRIGISARDEYGQRASSEIACLTLLSDQIIIDNVDPGFSVVGSWGTGSTAAGRYGADYRYAGTSPTGTYYADWTVQAGGAGTYNVCAWWSQGANRSSAATYTVSAGAQQFNRTVDQQADGGTWNLLGTLSLASGEVVTVRLSNQAPSGYVVIADAVKIEPAHTSVSGTSLARLLPDGAAIELVGVFVTAVFEQDFYVQSEKTPAAMRVQGSGVTEGSRVTVAGELATVSGERVLSNAAIR